MEHMVKKRGFRGTPNAEQLRPQSHVTHSVAMVKKENDLERGNVRRKPTTPTRFESTFTGKVGFWWASAWGQRALPPRSTFYPRLLHQSFVISNSCAEKWKEPTSNCAG